MRKETARIALCGVVAAMSVAVMFLTGLVPVATIAIPAIAGCFLIAVVAEIDLKHGALVYAVVAVLSFLLTPDREAALLYILFFGYYPVLYGLLSRIRHVVLQWVVKLLVFNAAAITEGLLAFFVLSIPIEELTTFGVMAIPVLLVLANAVFVLYDLCMNGLIVFYIQRLHGYVARYFK